MDINSYNFGRESYRVLVESDPEGASELDAPAMAHKYLGLDAGENPEAEAAWVEGFKDERRDEEDRDELERMSDDQIHREFERVFEREPDEEDGDLRSHLFAAIDARERENENRYGRKYPDALQEPFPLS